MVMPKIKSIKTGTVEFWAWVSVHVYVCITAGCCADHWEQKEGLTAQRMLADMGFNYPLTPRQLCIKFVNFRKRGDDVPSVLNSNMRRTGKGGTRASTDC